MTIYSLDLLISQPVHCSMSISNCCLLTCIQISQEASKVVWYFHLFKNFPEFVVIHTVKGFGIKVNKAEVDSFLKLSLFFNDLMDVGNLVYGSSAFSIHLEHLEVHGSCTFEDCLGEFWALLYQCVRWMQLCSSLSILWHCLSLELDWKLTFSSWGW